MRLIDADELMEHAAREKLDSRELIFEMIERAPTLKPNISSNGSIINPKDAPRFLNELACFFGNQLHDSDTMLKLAQCSALTMIIAENIRKFEKHEETHY